MKKTYVTPEIFVHGTVEDITQATGQYDGGRVIPFVGGSEPIHVMKLPARYDGSS